MFGLTYLCYGLLSLILAQAYLEIGVWGLVVFAMPVILAYQALVQGRRLEVADEQLRTQSAALRDASSRVAEERRDERLAVAAGLHDEVLPPLYNVHLMAQVLRQDLADGRLLDLEDDIPELLRAVTSASDAARGLISGLRKSPLGAAGFRGTLQLLVEHLQTLASAEFHVDVEDIDGPPIIQLLAYQVIRESLNNAVRHAAARRISVTAGVRAGAVRLIVEDDGRGFPTADATRGPHFGLSMMRERVELVGGILHVESSPGAGTRVIARLPVEMPESG
jgi:signal transduction histidine kinase